MRTFMKKDFVKKKNSCKKLSHTQSASVCALHTKREVLVKILNIIIKFTVIATEYCSLKHKRGTFAHFRLIAN